MKQISSQDIEALRNRIRERHDLHLEQTKLLKQQHSADPQTMHRRLNRVKMKLERLSALSGAGPDMDSQVRKLYGELQELRLYFGMPTGRPLEDRGVEFIAPYIDVLRIQLRLDPSLLLYVELIRTELALLEYRLKNQQDITSCLRSLAESLALCRQREPFTDIGDLHLLDLGHYLQLIGKCLNEQLDDGADSEPICRVYLEMAAAYSRFDCAPEKADSDFLSPFFQVIRLQMQKKQPSTYFCRCCLDTALWLQRFPLYKTQKKQLELWCMKAREVLKNA